jgi:5'-nucleotidase
LVFRQKHKQHDYPEDVRPGIEAIYNSPDFFENLEVMQGLHDGWQAMLDNGYLPRVASAPLESNRNAIEGKIKWLDRVMVPEFGVGVVEDAIIDKDKWKYRALAIIDDNPVIRKGVDGVESAEWEHILFGWSHLTTVPMATAAFRLLDWQDTDKLIQTLDIISERQG